MREQIKTTSVGRNSQGFFIMAETQDGDIYRHGYFFDNEEMADAASCIVQYSGSINLAHWGFIRTVYGSKAYQLEQVSA